MRPVSEEFLRTVRGSHVMRSRARVVDPGQTGTDPAGTEIPIINGDVKSTAKVSGGLEVKGASIRSSLSLETDGKGMWPAAASDLLAPYGNEIYVERGIFFGNGTVEWVGLGYFRINTPEQENPPDGPIRIQATDRMSGIIDARLVRPRQYAITTTLGTIVNDLVTEVYPSAVIDWDDNTDQSQLGRSLVVEKDRFKFLADLLTAAGKIFYWDYRGHFTIKDVPDPTETVYDVNAGANGVLINMSRDLSRDGVYNAVVASGEGADTEPPVTAVVVDDNPDSPTYWEGSFGKVPRFYYSPFVTSQTQVQSAAEAILRQSLGIPYNVSFGTVPNPALEALDSVQVIYPRTSGSHSMRTETHLIERLLVPLVPDWPMEAQTREQTLVVIGNA